MVLHTVWPVMIGQAPHPDGDRYLCQLAPFGMEPVASAAPRYWSYALFEWVPASSQLYDCINYPSSEIWLLKFIQWVTEVTGGVPGGLSFRWLVLLNCMVVGVLVGVFSYAVPGKLWVRVAASTGFLLVVGDSLFASYAAGPLGEYPGLVGVMTLGIGAVFLARTGPRQWFGLVLAGLGGLLAVTSKTQTITILLPIAVLLLATELRGRRARPAQAVEGKGRPARVIGLAVARRIVPAVVLAGLVVPALWMQTNNPKYFQAVNAWQVVSVGILPHSEDPVATLAELGLPASLADQVGRTAGDSPQVAFREDWQANTAKMNLANVAAYLLRHPDIALTIANKDAQDFFATRPTYLGSYEPGSGKMPEQLDLSLLTEINRQLYPSGILVWLFVLAGFAAVVLLLRKASLPDTWRRGFANGALLMLGFTVVQFLTAGFGDAIENTKHMVYSLLAAFLALAFLVAGAACRSPRGVLETATDAYAPDPAVPSALPARAMPVGTASLGAGVVGDASVAVDAVGVGVG